MAEISDSLGAKSSLRHGEMVNWQNLTLEESMTQCELYCHALPTYVKVSSTPAPRKKTTTIHEGFS